MQIDISEITKLTKDRNTSIRLVREYQKKYRGRSAVWVVERIIHDLQRDRGSISKVPTIRTRSKSIRPRKPLFQAVNTSNNQPSFNIWIAIAMPLTAQILRLTIPQLNFQMPANQNSLALEAPAYYQQLNHGSAVTIQNTSPEGVRVTLKAKDTDAKYTFNLAPCGGCRYYNTSQDLPEQCDPGPTYTLALPAGAYLATMNYDGQTRTESGEWHLAEGWEHFGCYYSLYNDRK